MRSTAVILSDKTIRDFIGSRSIGILPLVDDQINSADPGWKTDSTGQRRSATGHALLKLDEHNIAYIDLENPAKYISFEKEEIICRPIPLCWPRRWSTSDYPTT